MIKRTNGFTFVEVIIVVATMAVISTASVSTFSSINRSSADTKRNTALFKVTLAEETYYASNKCYSTDLLNSQNLDPETYVYTTDGSECPKWYVMFSKLQTGNTGPACNVTPGCLPVHYQSEWGCVVTGSYDCATVSALVLPEKQTTPNFIASVTSLFGGTTPTPTIGTTTPIPTVGTTAPIPTIGITTPSGIGGTTLPPTTADSLYQQGSDGSWCYDSNGGQGGLVQGKPQALFVPGFCIDKTGSYQDYCNSGTSRGYYCTGTWNGVTNTSVHCVNGGYVCSNDLGNACIGGSCTDSGAPTPVSATNPTTKTITGNDGTWCYDSDGTANYDTKGFCQDTDGLHTDYCYGSSTVDWACSGKWNGASYYSAKCHAGVYMTSNCINGVVALPGTPTPTPPQSIGGVTLPPATKTSDYLTADDGTWCYDSDGNGPMFYGAGMSVELSAPYTTVGFCIDTNGIHNDYCNSSGARDWYCNGTWNGSKWSSFHCAEGGFVCNSGGWSCVNGACADPNPPLAIGSTSSPVNKTLIGSDGTWCNDNGIVNDMLNKNSCQDNSGIKTDYCFGNNKVSYHCIGSWSGASYTGVKCGGSIFSCTSCVNAVCMSYVAPTGVGGS